MIATTVLVALRVPGHWVWVTIWMGLLLLGLAGLVGALHWSRRTGWRNTDEVLRGAGTVLVSLGMLSLLLGVLSFFAPTLLALALACFVGAFIAGKREEEMDREDD
jgi:CHASE2 domain-containing sensor protein